MAQEGAQRTESRKFPRVLFCMLYLGSGFVCRYHLRENDYRFDALQTNCFGINIKL